MQNTQVAGQPASDTQPKRHASGILFWYITREFLLPLTCCLVAFIALFIVRDTFDILSDFLEAREAGRAVIRDLFTYFLLQLPINLPTVLPMSIVLSACFMVSMLSRHHEISALRAAGLSLVTCGAPIWITAALLSGGVFVMGELFAPGCSSRTDDMLSFWTESQAYRTSNAKLAYTNLESRRDWFFEVFSRSGEQRGVLVKQFRPDDTTRWELRAARANYENSQWVFYDGFLNTFDAEGMLTVGPADAFDVRAFPELSETPLMILNQLRPVDELSIAHMVRVLEMNPTMPERARSTLLTTIWFRCTFPLACVVGALLGFGLSLSPERMATLRGFAIAVGLMVVYYVVSQAFLILGRNAYLPPPVGGALPTLAFLAWGGHIMYRKR